MAAEGYYFRFDRINRSFLGVVCAANYDFLKFDQLKEIVVTAMIESDLIKEIIFEGMWADYRSEEPDYLYIGDIVKDSTGNYSTFTPELKYHISEQTIEYIEEEDRVPTKQVTV